MRSIWPDEEVNPDEVLWRYLTTERLASALGSGVLYFPSASQFEDPFEGATAVVSLDAPSDARFPELDPMDQAFEDLRRITKISCWQRAQYESEAMWKLYADGRRGVAVKTTTGRLRAALQPFRLDPAYGEEEPFWGRVRYVDLHSERLEVDMLQRFFYKHRAFEPEQEFRVAVSLRIASESGVSVPEDGVNVPFVPTELVESIYFGPNVSTAERAAIVQACDAIDLKPTLVTSTLLGRPRYT